jgi:hypothetical protein
MYAPERKAQPIVISHQAKVQKEEMLLERADENSPFLSFSLFHFTQSYSSSCPSS